MFRETPTDNPNSSSLDPFGFGESVGPFQETNFATGV